MKKLIFLLIMAVAMVGMVSAGVIAGETFFGETCGETYSYEETQPFEVSLELAMSGFGMENLAVTPDTVLVVAFTEPLAGVLFGNTGQPKRSSMYNLARETRKQVDETMREAEYWLRL
jgi:hypothetical protein